MKVLVTGAEGQLGYDVCQRLHALSIPHKGIDLADCDLTDSAAVERCFTLYEPDCVIHCAAYTQVDKAETDSQLCFAVNEAATRCIARQCKLHNAKMLYVSTDYVFDGDGNIPLEADAPPKPYNVYGKSKLAGEQAVLETLTRFFIVRTSWVFGLHGHNFVQTMRRLGSQRESIQVVCDQIGSPTYTADLAILLCDMVLTESYGVYHATNEGYCSWHTFAEKIMALSSLPCQVAPIPSSQYPTPAKRPLNSRLSKRSLDEGGFQRLPSWEDALKRYIAALPSAT